MILMAVARTKKRANRTIWRTKMIDCLNADISKVVHVRYDIFDIIHGTKKDREKYSAKQLLSVFPYLMAIGSTYYYCKYPDIVDLGDSHKRILKLLKMSTSSNVKFNEMFKRGGYTDVKKLTKTVKYQDLPIQRNETIYYETQVKNNLFTPISDYKDTLSNFVNFNKGSSVIKQPYFALCNRYYDGYYYRGTFFDKYKTNPVWVRDILFLLHDKKLYPWEVGLYYYMVFKSTNSQTGGLYDMSYQDVMDYWGASKSTVVTMFKHLKEAGMIEIAKKGHTGRKQTIRIKPVKVKNYE